MKSKIKKALSDKHGSGTLYLGMLTIFLAFTVVAFCISVYQLYVCDIRAQLVSDAIADAAAVAGQNGYGFDNAAAETVANQIALSNGNLMQNRSRLTYTIDIKDEMTEFGVRTGYKIITVTTKIRTRTIFRNVFNRNPRLDTKGRSVVRAKIIVADNTYINWHEDDPEIFWERASDDGFLVTDARSATYIRYIINDSLCPEYNPTYDRMSPHGNGPQEEANFITAFLYFMKVTDFIKGLPEDVMDSYGDGEPGFENWTFSVNPADLQAAADAGQPVVIYVYNATDRKYASYVVVPTNNSDIYENGYIAVAYSNYTGTSNYKEIEWEALDNGINTVYGFIHE